MRYLYSIYLIFSFYAGNAQLNTEGSFCIVASCKDGIIIGADTRNSITPENNNKEILAYFDTVIKIFPLNKFVICTTGDVSIDDKFISYYIYEYRKFYQYKDELKLQTGDFFQFLITKYPSQLEKFKNAQMIFAGYRNNESWICTGRVNTLTQNIDISCVGKETYYATDTTCGFDTLYSEKLTCKQLMPLIKKSIIEYAAKNKKTESIGGQITFLKINKNNTVEWLVNDKKLPNINTMEELKREYKQGRLKIHFKSKEAKQEVEKKLLI
jgi:20S proteasome alpha/beta subunit